MTSQPSSRRRTALTEGLTLLLKALPVAILVMVLRYLLHDVLGIEGIMSFGDAGAVLTGTALIIGLMLAGVIADYKEAEKIPGVIGSSLLIFERLAEAGLSSQEKDSGWVRPRLAAIGTEIDNWFYGRITDGQVVEQQGELFKTIVEVEKAGCSTTYIVQMLVRATEAAGAIQRAMSIRNTQFIKAGYALMTILVAVVLILLVIADFPSDVAQWVVCGALSLVYTYLLLLVRDLDNPFGYGDNKGRGSGADVDLSPFTSALDLLKRPVG
jgi:hypothetical protein